MVRTSRTFAILFVLALALSGCASPALQTTRTPEEVGLSSQRLKELSAAFQAKVDSGELPGVVILVARDNKIAWFDAIGYRDREAKSPMTKDALFRIASMTKPLTSLSIMLLAEEGKLKSADPVSRYLPEFKDPKVGVEKPDPSGNPQLVMEAAKREITLLDLLRHTSGITYGIFGKSMVKDLYNSSNLFDPTQSSAEFIGKLAKLPLQYQPGTRWDYGMSADVLARVVEVVSGMEMDRFVHERILKPLRMNDTGYWVDAPRHGRIAEPQAIAATGKRPAFSVVTVKSRWTPGGHGLVSTAADYARFCQMLLNGGTLDGVRIASRETIDAMRSDHLPKGLAAMNPAIASAFGIIAPTSENGQRFGLGFLVRTSAGVNRIPGSVGDYSWASVQGAYFWVDPKERLFAILMLQAPPPVNRAQRLPMREHVYRALKN
jgi:CubicO group peptidase (beta-lactamase class C family)